MFLPLQDADELAKTETEGGQDECQPANEYDKCAVFLTRQFRTLGLLALFLRHNDSDDLSAYYARYASFGEVTENAENVTRRDP